MNCKNKSFMTKRKAFTLIELLIVIAIIGILFIVLVSKVDFATDKAKASGVQTDFRSFQMAFDTVAKENAGFNTFGWDTGDANQNGKRDSYDEGDNGAGGGIAKNGIQDGTEVFTGHKVYAETFTNVYSLKKNGTGSYDRDALNRLETAINANLDPKLHITIKDDGEIVMANGAKDPWNKEYHGWYITNAETDKKDRGAIVMYSDGANNEFGSEHEIANGVVTIFVPGSNKNGKDDYSIVSCYTYINGYGEVKNVTTGFSNNQNMLDGNNSEVVINPNPDEIEPPVGNNISITNGTNQVVTSATSLLFTSSANYDNFVEVKIDNQTIPRSWYYLHNGSTIVELTQSYVGLLTNGTHTIDIVSTDGIATCTFVVNYPDCEHNFYDNQCTKCQRYNCAINNNHLDEVTSWYEQGEDGFCDICSLHLCAFTNKHFDFWSDMGENPDNYCDGCAKPMCQFNGVHFEITEEWDYENDCPYNPADGYCDGCGVQTCNGNVHLDNDSNQYCDICNMFVVNGSVPDCYYDICQGEPECIYCGSWRGYTSCAMHGYDEYNYDGHCDGCNAILCNGHNDFDNNTFCDYCNVPTYVYLSCNHDGQEYCGICNLKQ